jgi:hypothetical protein
MKRILRRPSPAMVIAIVALIAALGGTAVAGGVLNKKKVNNIITNRAPGLSVSHAKTADSATNADKVGGVGAGGFLPSSGNFQVQIASDEWVETGAASTVAHFTGETDLKSNTANQFFNAPISIPSAIQGRATQINSVVLCYAVNANATLDEFFLDKTTATTNLGPTTQLVADDTNRTDTTCRTYTPTGGSAAVGPNDMIQVVIRADFAAASSIGVSRLTVNMSD